MGQRLRNGLDDLVARHGVGEIVRVNGEPERNVVTFPGERELVHKSVVQQFLIERGILFNGSMFISNRHTIIDIDDTIDAFDDAFHALAHTADPATLLEGPAVEAVFRKP